MPDSDHHAEHHPAALPGAEGSEFYAPPEPERRRRAGDHGPAADRRKSSFQLRHRSQRDFPQAYEPVSTVFWEGLSKQQVDAVMRLQATAMEKAGFEKGTPKFFIEDFDPNSPGTSSPAATAQRSTGTLDLVAQAAPRLVLGGVLIGMGALAMALGLTGILQPLAPVAGASAAALAVGLVLAFTGR